MQIRHSWKLWLCAMLPVCLAIALANQAYAAAATQSAPAAPVFAPGGGNYISCQKVRISASTKDAEIYYTTNGTTPSTSSRRYKASIEVAGTLTIRAMAIGKGRKLHAESSATYTISPPAAMPVFSIAAGTYSSNQMVGIADSTPGAA